MAGFDLGDLGKKAQGMLNDEKVQKALHSEQAENVSDKVLDGVEDAVNKATGGKHKGQVADARKNVDKHVGNE